MPENEQMKHHEWSADLLQKFAELPLPSLYDYLLTQEKLVAEIRKQNKELKIQSEKIQKTEDSVSNLVNICDELNDKMGLPYENFLSEGEIESHSNEFFEQAQAILMQSLDYLLNQMNAATEMKETVLHLLPKQGMFWSFSPPLWKGQVEQVLEGYNRGVETVHDKIIASLADLNIEVLIPQVNDPFDPHKHRAIEQIAGSLSRTIAKIIRYGYTQNGKILRYVDVAVYR